MANESTTGLSDPENRLHEAIATFEDARDAGQDPDPQEWLRRYGDVAGRLAEFFANQERVCRLASALLPPETDDKLPVIQDYQILEKLPASGQGVVYKARQLSANRLVALKLIPSARLEGLSTRRRQQTLDRFRTEAQAAAQLEHPNIVGVHEIGEIDGAPFYSMQYVAGSNLAERIAQGSLSAGQAAAYIEQVALAIHVAHQHGILHRDLNPANILIDSASDRPLVADFGLAKLLQPGPDTTGTGDVIGTAPYMSPEQAQDSSRVTVASDVYGLGATLYALLTGRPPFQGDNPVTVLKKVIEEEPAAPRKIKPGIPRDLETICLKCLEKRPARRYASALELAGRLRMFLENKPIPDRAIGTAERLARWCRRNPVLAALDALIVAGVIGATTAAIIFNQQRKTALHNLGRAEKAEADALRESKSAREAEQQARKRLWGSYLAQAKAGRFSGQAGQRFGGLDVLAKAAAIETSMEVRNEAIACMALPDLRAVGPGEPRPPVDAIGAWALLVAIDNDGTVTLTRRSNGAELARLPNTHGKVELVRLSPDGNWAAVKHAGQNHTVWVVWDWRRAKALLQARHEPGTPWGWSPDSACFFYGGTDGLLRVHDLVRNADIHRIALRQAPRIAKEEHVALSPDRGKLAIVGKQASATSQATVQVFDLRTGEVAAEFLHPHVYPHAHLVWRIAWGPDNRLLAAACSSDLYIWDVPHKKQQAVIKNVRADWAMVFTREANILVSSGSTGLIQLSDPLTGTLLVSIPGKFPNALVGERWLPLAWPAPSGFYEINLGKECRRLHTGIRDFGPRAAFHPQGRWLALVDHLGVRLFDLATFREAAFLDLGRSETILFHPDGDLLTYSGEHGLHRWPVRPDPEQPAGAVLVGPPQLLQMPPAELYSNWAALGPNGQVVAADIGRRQAVLLNTDHPEERTVLGPHQGVRCVSMSPDGRWAATGHWIGKSINVWDTKTGRLVKEFPTPGNRAANVLFTPDGRWLIGCLEKEYLFWNVGSWDVDHVLQRKEQGWPGMAAVSPDHRLLAICDTVWEVKLLDLKTSREIARLPAETNRMITGLCFSPDASQLVVARSDDALLWDLRLIRAQLAAMGLDWDLPAYRPRADDAPWEPIRVRVATGNPLPSAPRNVE